MIILNDFCKRAFENAKILGCRQYVFVNFDDNGEIEDKTALIFKFDYKNKYLFSDGHCFFDEDRSSFWNLFDIINNLSKAELCDILSHISNMVCKGSTIIFNYPVYDDTVQYGYSYGEIENMLEKTGFLIYEHFNCDHLRKIAFCVAVKE